MANEEATKDQDILKTATNSPLIGHQAKPTVLDSTTKLDIDTTKSLVDNIIEAGLSHTLDTSAIESFTSISNARDQIYQLIDTMCADSAVSSIVRTYAEDVCELADNGHIVWCESADPQIAKFVNYLLKLKPKTESLFIFCMNRPIRFWLDYLVPNDQLKQHAKIFARETYYMEEHVEFVAESLKKRFNQANDIWRKQKIY